MNLVYHVFHYCNNDVSASYAMDATLIHYYDLTMVMEGRLLYVVQDKPMLLEEGDIMLLPPGTKRQRLALDEPVHYVSFNFRTEEHIDLPPLMKDSVTGEVRALFKAFTPHHLYDETRGREKASAVIGYIIADIIDINQFAHLNPHIRRAIAYIDKHITGRLTLSEIAKELHLSREYTANLFKKETGMTVSQFIKERKLSLACDLLREQEKSLGDIAKSLGYDNYGYFSRTFKKRFGVSPTRFSE